MLKTIQEKFTSKETPKKEINLDSIEKQEKLLFEEIKQAQKELSKSDFQLIVNRLFEHSSADALDYANKLGLASKEILIAITQPQFYIKHQKLADSIIKTISSEIKYIDNEEEALEVKEVLDKYKKTVESASFYEEEYLNQIKQKKKANPRAKELLENIDTYYLNFLDTKEFDLKQEQFNLNKLDELIYSQLQRAKYATSPYYYSFNVGKALKEEGLDDNQIKPLIKDDIVSQEDLNSFLSEYKISSTIFETRLKNARYSPLSLIYTQGKKISKENIISYLNKSIKKRLGEEKEIVFDKETNSYKVEGLETKDSPEDDKEVIKEKVLYDGSDEVKCLNFDSSFTTFLNNNKKRLIFNKNDERIGKEYEWLDGATIEKINNQIYFVSKKNNELFIIGPDGKIVGEEYDSTFDPLNVNNQLYFIAKKNNKEFIIGPNGQKIGGEYDDVSFIENINNKLYFIAKKNNKEFIIGPNGQKIGGDYDSVWYPKNLNNQAYFEARENGKEFIVGPNGQRIGREYDKVNFFEDYENSYKLAYFKAVDNNKKFIIDSNGQKIGNETEDVENLLHVNNKLYYIDKKNNKKFIFGSDGKRIGEEYDWVDDQLYNINGQTYFIAKNRDGFFIINLSSNSQRKLGDGYDNISYLKNYNNELCFKAKKNNKEFIINSNGQRIGEEYDKINFFDNVVNRHRLAYFKAIDNNKKFIINSNGQKIGNEIEDVKNLLHVNNKLYYIAKDGDKQFVVDPYGRKISSDFIYIGFFNYCKDSGEIVIKGRKNDKLVSERIKIKSDKDKLSEQEKKYLNILNIIHEPDSESVREIIDEIKEGNSKIFNEKNLSKAQIYTLNQISNQDKSILIDTVSAKEDRSISRLSFQVINKIFPEILSNKEKAKKEFENNFWSKLGFNSVDSEHKKRKEKWSFNHKNRQNANSYEGGFFVDNPETALTSRESISGMMATNLFAKYNKENNQWEKLEFKVNNQLKEPVKEVTVKLHNIGNSLNTILPKPLGSKIISERVKGIKENGKEVDLEISVNALNEVVCTSSEKVKEISYSFQMSEIFEEVKDVDDRVYQDFKDKLDNSRELTKGIANLPEDLKIFINSLKNKRPKERVLAIENYVRSNSYYDYKNEETLDLKNGKNLDELIDIMELRAVELKEKGLINDNIKYAGVCADFAILTTALLKEAGIASGLLYGYNMSSKTATENDSHGCSFVVWPDENNDNRVISVDGTPRGYSSTGDVIYQSDSLEEKEEKAQKVKEEIINQAKEKLAEIEKRIENYDEKFLTELSNGKLEHVLNDILRFDVNYENLEVIKSILNAYWYSPIKDLNLDNTKERISFLEFISFETKKTRENINKQDINNYLGKAGSELFNTIEDFIKRFAKRDKNIKSIQNGLNLINKVYENISKQLTESEKRAFLVIIKYLEAKNVSR